MKLLRREKDALIKDCTYRKDIKTKGIKKKRSYFEDFHVILSGAYIYFYKMRSDLVPYYFMQVNETLIDHD
jgi:hypothetical protein